MSATAVAASRASWEQKRILRVRSWNRFPQREQVAVLCKRLTARGRSQFGQMTTPYSVLDIQYSNKG